jgi:hypothetical protein
MFLLCIIQNDGNLLLNGHLQINTGIHPVMGFHSISIWLFFSTIIAEMFPLLTRKENAWQKKWER